MRNRRLCFGRCRYCLTRNYPHYSRTQRSYYRARLRRRYSSPPEFHRHPAQSSWSRRLWSLITLYELRPHGRNCCIDRRPRRESDLSHRSDRVELRQWKVTEANPSVASMSVPLPWHCSISRFRHLYRRCIEYSHSLDARQRHELHRPLRGS